jgi:hypothetical protein
MTRMRVIVVRMVVSIVWGGFGSLGAASAADQFPAQIIYNACLGTKDSMTSFCFGYLSAAAQTWAQAGTRYGDANLTSLCREGGTIDPADLTSRFIEHLEAHPEAKTQLALQVVFDLVCTERK